jgi:hypothetical protein
MKLIHIPFLLVVINGYGQKLTKAYNLTQVNLKNHLNYLSDDSLEGRRAGTRGEKLAADYISSMFKQYGLTPIGTPNGFFQEFEIADGKKVSDESFFSVNDKKLKPGKDYFPLNSSANIPVLSDNVTPSLSEAGHPWFLDIAEILADNKDNPHFDIKNAIVTNCEKIISKGATAVFVHNSSNINDNLFFDAKSKEENLKAPIVYITKECMDKYFQDPSDTYNVQLRIMIISTTRKTQNIIGFKDNHAPFTLVFGAHYDHLGYGEDGNSMNRTGAPMIHNGADDNASGTAALIEISRLLSTQKKNSFNYLFIAFSAEELGLLGSKYFVEHPTIDLNTINYMINMDMIGRMSDSTRTITIGGYGTSPSWNDILNKTKSNFRVKLDSSGTGPSDHTSFYRKNIPVLFFFTGLHSDYHKPTDDADKINYLAMTDIVNYTVNIVRNSKIPQKLVFTKTREQQTSTSTRFSVSMGIMPDYSYSGTGVRVDGLSEGRPAIKAGLLAGDIVVKMGDTNIDSVEAYMKALGKFKKGDSTNVVVLRSGLEKTFNITF